MSDDNYLAVAFSAMLHGSKVQYVLHNGVIVGIDIDNVVYPVIKGKVYHE